MKNSSIKGADKGEKPWGRTAVGQNRQGCIYFPFYFQVSLNFKETLELKIHNGEENRGASSAEKIITEIWKVKAKGKVAEELTGSQLSPEYLQRGLQPWEGLPAQEKRKWAPEP